jgi:hypothetical protein
MSNMLLRLPSLPFLFSSHTQQQSKNLFLPNNINPLHSFFGTSVNKKNTMSNVRGLYDEKSSDDEKDHENDRFVGGIGDRGGGRYDIDETIEKHALCVVLL